MMNTENSWQLFLKNLRQHIGKEKISTRLIDRLALSSDAGFYRLIPKCIVRPHNINDIVSIFAAANRFRVAVTFRAAGTSLSGQSVSDSVLVDISRYFRGMDIRNQGELVQVEPSVIGAHVNQHLKSFWRKIGPDPASIQAAMLGGILANNSGGMCCGTADNAYHTLHSLQAVLPNGFVFSSHDSQDEERLQKTYPHIHNGLLALRERLLADDVMRKKIRSKYKIKNTIGYSLNAFLDYQKPLQILARLLIGSEGTLGFIASAVLKTVPSHPYKLTALLFFENVFLAADAVPALSDAASVELMDRSSLRSIEENLQKKSTDLFMFVRDLPLQATVLLVEYEFADEQAREKAKPQLQKHFSSFVLLRPPSLTTDSGEQELYWSLRKGLYPSVGALRPPGSITLIEDFAVAPTDLANFCVDLQQLFKKHDFAQAVLFGHAKDGNLHFVLTLKFDNPTQLANYENLMNDVIEITLSKYNGSLKGEHGTGRNMAPFVEQEWGQDVYAVMQEVKNLLDPLNICNPGVIINADKQVHLRDLKNFPLVDKNIDLCIECGFCESHCPSRDLTLTPRQRISLLRHLADNQLTSVEKKLVMKDYPYMLLDTCATDGLCALACPVNIDTGVQVKKIRANRNGRLSHFTADIFAAYMNALTFILRAGLNIIHALSLVVFFRKITSVFNKLFHWPLFPLYLYPPRSHPFSQKNNSEQAQADFLYFSTCVSRTLGGYPREKPELADLLLQLSRKAGYHLQVPAKVEELCCGMPFVSKGFSQSGEQLGLKTLRQLYQDSQKGKLPIIVDTASCTYTFLQHLRESGHADTPEFRDLKIIDISEFAAAYLLPHLNIHKRLDSAALHIPCAISKLKGEKFYRTIAHACAEEVFFPSQANCCGAAGDRAMLFPELGVAATRQEVLELNRKKYTGYYSGAVTCENNLSERSGHLYLSLLHLLDEVSEEKHSENISAKI